MSDWKSDKKWTDGYLSYVKRVCGAHLIGEAPQQDDAERNTDLIVLKMDAVRIACRIRRPIHIRYACQFTVRSSRPNGTKTELAKIVEGWGDYIFYGFAIEDTTTVCPWILGDLRVFRAWYADQLRQNSGREPGELQPNADGSSTFRAFNIDALPRTFIIARKQAVNRAMVVDLSSEHRR